jgi:hypothetical protein
VIQQAGVHEDMEGLDVHAGLDVQSGRQASGIRGRGLQWRSAAHAACAPMPRSTSANKRSGKHQCCAPPGMARHVRHFNCSSDRTCVSSARHYRMKLLCGRAGWQWMLISMGAGIRELPPDFTTSLFKARCRLAHESPQSQGASRAPCFTT